MSLSDRNSGKPWTPTDKSQLKSLAGQNTPTRVIGLKMGRTESAIYTQASQQGVSLAPTNQRPYNRSK
ncbi:MAG TPA: hypothetical protein VG734_17985 [Lacunisphaera sp.]|nr:hypothetical protein [Lacunisphaera sp.]